MSRSAQKPDTVSFTPGTRSNRGVQRRASRSARGARPRCSTSSATIRSAPDSIRFTISSMVSGECTKSACSVMAQSRLGRSVRCKARRSSSSRLLAYPCRAGWVSTVSGNTLAYEASTAPVPSFDPSSATSSWYSRGNAVNTCRTFHSTSPIVWASLCAGTQT